MELAKPRNLREKAAVERELRRKYPQMYNSDGSLKKQYGGKKVKKTKRTKDVSSGLKAAGLSNADLARLR